MIELILTAALFILYMLGVVVAKDHVDLIEEVENDYLPRPGAYWAFILSWPVIAVRALFLKDEDDE